MTAMTDNTNPFSVGFEPRVHLALISNPHRIGAPAVGLCNTVFVPDLDADLSDLPRCRECHEAQVSYLLHCASEMENEAHELRRQLDAQKRVA